MRLYSHVYVCAPHGGLVPSDSLRLLLQMSVHSHRGAEIKLWSSEEQQVFLALNQVCNPDYALPYHLYLDMCSKF